MLPGLSAFRFFPSARYSEILQLVSIARSLHSLRRCWSLIVPVVRLDRFVIGPILRQFHLTCSVFHSGPRGHRTRAMKCFYPMNSNQEKGPCPILLNPIPGV